ncbi:DUF2213 domain-containing protein [Klebsiella pneumoniae]|uniref:DUF2213 domain-containing protein n=1 Tax=Klebsiella pneumoniae TaxID=573 RepID=A0A483EBL9_KLEPN|nr:hypothetical protein [Klebsiella pneumoniae]EIW0118990.1 DUF2213 domain-containing protein [Klebsiella pneumoniae]EIW8671020.1 DUF2213 domain-containing protein [Klebsiella pneumoniae]EIW8684910.1 DUF2213 domain-containing protein [Klebsiella pneumoniae]EIW8713004.1 DUF2213 domain-containing protein [Klebsiella pneumoniae]EIW9032103.1 DUF2213 domain-containing protein [Klebsiella pneumoniae]
MNLTSIHVKSLAINASNISTTTINGQEHYVIRGAVPIVDDIVMNGGLYPAEEINNSYKTMEGKLMPLPHPMVDGKYVSANDPRAINSYHVGAWAQNVSKSGDQVVMDVYINKAVAETKPDGKRLINRLDEMIAGTNTDPIHLSTGLLTNKERKSGESKKKKYSWIARNMQFDHIAILLDEPGAGTPEEGVGMFVNADGQEGEVETASLVEAANSLKDGLLNKVKFFLTHNSDASFDEIYQMLREAIRAPSGSDVYRYVVTVWPDKFIFEEGNKLFQQKYLIDDSTVTLVGDPVEVVRKPTEYEVKTNGETNPMKEKMIAALNAAGVKTEGLTDDQVWDAYNQQVQKKAGDQPGTQINSDAITAAVNLAIKPLTDEISTLKTQLQANAEKDLKTKREAVKAKFPFMTEAAINSLAGEALNDMYAQCQTSTGLNPSFQQVNAENDQWKDYDLNAGIDQEKK